MADQRRMLRAKNGFYVGSTRQVVKSGQVVPSDHPVVAGREELFEPVESDIETATRAPGEMRITPRRPDAVVAKAAKPAKKATPRKAPG
jgi:hypothetical protein